MASAGQSPPASDGTGPPFLELRWPHSLHPSGLGPTSLLLLQLETAPPPPPVVFKSHGVRVYLLLGMRMGWVRAALGSGYNLAPLAGWQQTKLQG